MDKNQKFLYFAVHDNDFSIIHIGLAANPLNALAAVRAETGVQINFIGLVKATPGHRHDFAILLHESRISEFAFGLSDTLREFVNGLPSISQYICDEPIPTLITAPDYIIGLYLEGYTMDEIGILHGTSKQNISVYIGRHILNRKQIRKRNPMPIAEALNKLATERPLLATSGDR